MHGAAIRMPAKGGGCQGHETCPTRGREAKTVKPKEYEPGNTLQVIERGCRTFAH